MKHSRFIADACEYVAQTLEADKENAVRMNTAWMAQRFRQNVTFAWGRGAIFMASAVVVILLVAAVTR